MTVTVNCWPTAEAGMRRITCVVPSAAAPFTTPVVAEAMELVLVVTDVPLSSPATTGSIRLYVAPWPVAAMGTTAASTRVRAKRFPMGPPSQMLIIDLLPVIPRYT